MAKLPRRCLFIVVWIFAQAFCNQLYSEDATPPIPSGATFVATDSAVSTADTRLEQQLSELATAPAWHKLIKVTQAGHNTFQTDILADSFFLADGSPPSPADELSATVKALRSQTVTGDSHAQCRFPARLHWLTAMAPELAGTFPRVNCPQLDAWVSQTSGKQFYLVHVSGYFANPASAFGHLLIRVGDGKSKRGLLDAGINFGARIPPSDGSLTYMLKGLFGGYTASFSTQEHYLQDKVYSGTESRDMWAYELKLTPHQEALFRFHLWELMDQPFKYYFLKKNCAYRVAEILELVFDSDFFIDDSAPYYAPVELFNKLEAHHKRHSDNTYRSLDFIPSHKRETFAAFENLSEKDAHDANAFLKTREFAQSDISVEALDFLLEYLDYSIQTAASEQRADLRNLKQDVIRLRLKQPARPENPVPIGALPAPGGGPKPATVRLSITERGSTADRHQAAQGNNEHAFELEISPFWYDLLDETRGSLIDSAFRALVLNVRLQDDELNFNQLTLLDVQKFAPESAAIYGESSYAWRGAAALVNRAGCATFCPVASFSGSFGRSFAVNSGAVYATLDASLTSTLAEQRVGVSLGSLYQLPWHLRGRWHTEYRAYSKSGEDSEWKHQLQLQRSIGQNHAVDVSWVYEHSNQLTLGYKFKW